MLKDKIFLKYILKNIILPSQILQLYITRALINRGSIQL